MERTAWTDGRLDEKMSAIDTTQDRFVQICFGLVAVQLSALVALVVALA